MGRYAQSHRRGGQRWQGPVSPAPLPAPSPPYIEVNWNDGHYTLIVRSACVPDDVGGLFVLELSSDGNNWYVETTKLNDGSGVPFDLDPEFVGYYVRARESGNSTVYDGTSEPSDEQQLEEP